MKSAVVRLLMSTVLVCIASGCATSGTRTTTTPSPLPAQDAKVSLSAAQDARLGTVVRHLGEQSGAGLVLMQGLEWVDVGAVGFDNVPLATATESLVAEFHGQVQSAPGYYFLYPAGYEALENVSVEGRLPASLAQETVAIAFGAGTRIYTVLAVLSKTLGVTLVADNAIAESECGEIALPELPLTVVLDAVLKSARVPNEAFEIWGQDDYALIRRHGDATPPDLLLNAQAAGHAALKKKVSFELPYPQAPGESIAVYPGASPLVDVLPSLSQQIGMRVTAERALAELPVNPMVVQNLPRETALELLIRQWLVPRYGYTVADDRIVLREIPAR